MITSSEHKMLVEELENLLLEEPSSKDKDFLDKFANSMIPSYIEVIKGFAAVNQIVHESNDIPEETKDNIISTIKAIKNFTERHTNLADFETPAVFSNVFTSYIRLLFVYTVYLNGIEIEDPIMKLALMEINATILTYDENVRQVLSEV